MGAKSQGTLLIIGGAEDKKHDCVILRKFIELAGDHDSNLAVITTATEYPREVGAEYRNLFLDLGAREVSLVHMPSRDAANDLNCARQIENCTGIFFTGGDQLRLTSILGGSHSYRAIRKAYEKGTVVAGTSAGASVMSDTMIIYGDGSDSPKKNTLNMAHGMGLIEEVVIDQHFAQRGRINRLLTAVAQNPYVIGLGIDEDTAVIVNNEAICQVVGSQTVTVVDGMHVTCSNVSELKPDEPLALTDVVIHILPKNYKYDLRRRQVVIEGAQENSN